MTHLLMIEDDRVLAEMVGTYLGRAGMTLEHRESAAAGLAAALGGGYDAVVLDLMLPDGDGLALCRTIRAHSDVPILMLTARGDEADRRAPGRDRCRSCPHGARSRRPRHRVRAGGPAARQPGGTPA